MRPLPDVRGSRPSVNWSPTVAFQLRDFLPLRFYVILSMDLIGGGSVSLPGRGHYKRPWVRHRATVPRDSVGSLPDGVTAPHAVAQLPCWALYASKRTSPGHHVFGLFLYRGCYQFSETYLTRKKLIFLTSIPIHFLLHSIHKIQSSISQTHLRSF